MTHQNTYDNMAMKYIKLFIEMDIHEILSSIDLDKYVCQKSVIASDSLVSRKIISTCYITLACYMTFTPLFIVALPLHLDY